jgi:hypothetical protein
MSNKNTRPELYQSAIFPVLIVGGISVGILLDKYATRINARISAEEVAAKYREWKRTGNEVAIAALQARLTKLRDSASMPDEEAKLFLANLKKLNVPSP